MLLQEILDNPFKYELNQEYFGDWVGHFKDATGNLVIVNFKYSGEADMYIIEFKRKGDYTMTHDSPPDSNQGVRIMSTVILMTTDFLRRIEKRGENPAKFLVYAVDKDETSRASLYQRFVKRLASQNGFREIANVKETDHPGLERWWSRNAESDHHNLILLGKKN